MSKRRNYKRKRKSGPKLTRPTTKTTDVCNVRPGDFMKIAFIDLSELMSHRPETLVLDNDHHEGLRHIVRFAQTRLVAMVTC